MKANATYKILKVQIVFNIIISILIFNDLENYYNYLVQGTGNYIFIFQSFILIFALLSNQRSKLTNILFLPYIFMINYSLVIGRFIELYPTAYILLYLSYFSGMIILLIPVIINVYGSIKNNILRLLALIWLFDISVNSALSMTFVTLKKNPILYALDNSRFVYALMSVVCIYYLMKIWNYRFSFSWHMVGLDKRYFVTFIVTIIFMLWYVFFNTFLLLADSVNNIFYNWDFSLIDPNNSATLKNSLTIFFDSLQPGIGEEVLRYAEMVILLTLFKNNKYQLEYTVLISSTFFGLSHLPYLTDPTWVKTEALELIITAFGTGCLLSVLLLFTGKLWLNMFMHFLLNFAAYSVTPIGGIKSRAIFNFANGWILSTGISLAVFVGFAFLLLKLNKKAIKTALIF